MFEACGLYFILRRTDNGTGSVFQLCDEAFSNSPIRIRATSYKGLFAAVEKNIGLSLPRQVRNAIRRKLGALGVSARPFSGQALLGSPPPQAQELKAVGL